MSTRTIKSYLWRYKKGDWLIKYYNNDTNRTFVSIFKLYSILYKSKHCAVFYYKEQYYIDVKYLEINDLKPNDYNQNELFQYMESSKQSEIETIVRKLNKKEKKLFGPIILPYQLRMIVGNKIATICVDYTKKICKKII